MDPIFEQEQDQLRRLESQQQGGKFCSYQEYGKQNNGLDE